jgi:hypothetical protein
MELIKVDNGLTVFAEDVMYEILKRITIGSWTLFQKLFQKED